MRRLLLALLCAGAAQAQPSAPHIAYLYPAGGQSGTTVEVEAGGQFLKEVTRAFVSGPGLKVRVGQYQRPMTGQEANDLRMELQDLRRQPASPEAQERIAEIERRLATFNREMNPVLAETVKLEVTIEPGTRPGPRELRLGSPQGLSAPIAFTVGELSEFIEPQSDVRVIRPGAPAAETEYEEPRLNLPVTVNGRIVPRPAHAQQARFLGRLFTPGDVDRYRFHARQGASLVMAVRARELMPYLADAVPGWFQPVLALHDSAGHEVAYNDGYTFHPDPVLHYVIPRDGEYTVEIRDALYRGREDFVYRLTIGELPFVTSLFPLGGRAGSRVKVALNGWNLGASQIAMDLKKRAADTAPLELALKLPAQESVRFAVDSLPELLEKEPNDSEKSAQRVKLPVIVNGRIDRPGDWDFYRFTGRAGQELVAEVTARRLGSPLDSMLRLSDARGRQIAFNDDHEDRAAGLLTHQADSYLAVRLPANGTYYLAIGDTQQQGGPEYAYRIRIGAPRPDFELFVTPASVNAGRGLSVPMEVHAVRRDGFSGEIALALNGAPAGYALSGATLNAGQDDARFTLAVPASASPQEPARVRIEGRAMVQGREVVRRARPADDMTQAFFNHHLVPAEEQMLMVVRRAGLRAPARIAGPRLLRIPAGGAAALRAQVELPPNANFGRLMFELGNPPAGVEIGAVQQSGPEVTVTVRCQPDGSKPSTKGNLIVHIVAERMAPASAKAPGRVTRVELGVLPAIPFEIVRP